MVSLQTARCGMIVVLLYVRGKTGPSNFSEFEHQYNFLILRRVFLHHEEKY